MEKNNIEISLAVVHYKGEDYFYLGGNKYENKKTREVLEIPEIKTTTPENFRGFEIYKGNNFFKK